MSDFEKLFKVTEDSIELNKPELKFHPIFKKIIGSERNKLQDMMFVYSMGHPKGMFSHLMGDEKLKEIKKLIGREIEWQPSAILNAAASEYERLVNVSPTGKAFLAANKSLYEAGEDINDIVETNKSLKVMVKKRVNALQSKQLGGVEEMENMEQTAVLLKQIMNNQKDINAIIKELPNMTATVEKIATAWASEEGGQAEIYGGGKLGNRE